MRAWHRRCAPARAALRVSRLLSAASTKRALVLPEPRPLLINFRVLHLHWTRIAGSRGSASLPSDLRRRIARERVPFAPIACERVAIKHLHQPICQFIPGRRCVHQSIPSTKTKSLAKSRSIDHARVSPVEPDLLNAFPHNILQRAVQLELPTHDVGVREQFAELENQFRLGNKPKLDGFSIA